MYVDDFPGPLINFKINNLTKVEETQFPPGVLEGQSPSILFYLTVLSIQLQNPRHRMALQRTTRGLRWCRMQSGRAGPAAMRNL